MLLHAFPGEDGTTAAGYSNRRLPLYDPYQHYYNGSNKQEMDESSKRVAADQTENPQDQQDHG